MKVKGYMYPQMKKPVGMLGMLTEILLMTFVKSFQWYVD
jgi:hypothetical protein